MISNSIFVVVVVVENSRIHLGSSVEIVNSVCCSVLVKSQIGVVDSIATIKCFHFIIVLVIDESKQLTEKMYVNSRVVNMNTSVRQIAPNEQIF